MPLIPPDVSEKDVRDEANRCSHRAGYCDRDGQPKTAPKIRSRWSQAYRENYGKVFGHD